MTTTQNIRRGFLSFKKKLYSWIHLNLIKIIKGGTLIKKVFYQAKETSPDILYDGHSEVPMPNRKCNKMCWHDFFHITLGLNSLPGSCVRDLPRIYSNLIKVNFRPMFLQNIQNLFSELKINILIWFKCQSFSSKNMTPKLSGNVGCTFRFRACVTGGPFLKFWNCSNTTIVLY